MKLKDVLMVLAIIVLTIFVTFYGINTLFPKPQHEDYCGEFKTAFGIENQEQCEAVGGRWDPYEDSRPVEEIREGYCDRDYECRQELDEARSKRSKFVFFVALPLGILIIILGSFVFGLEPIGAGLMGGGVGTLIYGSGAFWPYTENWAKFLISLIGLAVLIWFSYYFNRKLGKK